MGLSGKLLGRSRQSDQKHQQTKEKSTTMSTPVIVPGKPIVLELEPGTYYRCVCGGSKNMLFCDGACKGSGRAPVPFEVKEKQEVSLCNCGKSRNGPFCDGRCAA